MFQKIGNINLFPEHVSTSRHDTRKAGEYYEGLVAGILKTKGINADPNSKKQYIGKEHRTVGYDLDVGNRLAMEVKARGRNNYINPKELGRSVVNKFEYTRRRRVLAHIGGQFKDPIIPYRLQRYGIDVVWLRDLTQRSLLAFIRVIQHLDEEPDKLLNVAVVGELLGFLASRGLLFSTFRWNGGCG